MAEIDLSSLSEADLNQIREKVLRDLLQQASLRNTDTARMREGGGYDKHGSLHSKG